MHELSAKRRDELIDWFVDQARKRQLITPAIMFLEINRPLTFVASSASAVLAPIIGTYLNTNMMDEIRLILEDRKNLDIVIERLEKAAVEQDRLEREHRQRVKEERDKRRQARAQGSVPPADETKSDGQSQPPESKQS